MVTRWDMLNKLQEHFSDDSQLLTEITDAMSNAEFKEIYDYICRMWGIDIEEQED